MIRRAALALAVLGAAGCGGAPPPAARTFEPDSIPEAYARSTAAMMAPGATRAWQITPEGGFANGAWRVDVRARAGGIEAGAPRAIAAEERTIPVFHWTRRAGDVRFDFEAAALPDRAPRDSALLASIEVVVENGGRDPCEASVEWTLREPGPDALFLAWDFDPAVEGSAALAWATAEAAGLAHGRGEGVAAGRHLTQRWTLAPGARRAACVLLPTYPTPAPALVDLARGRHAVFADEVRRTWREALAPGTLLTLGDPEVERAWDAARVILLSLRERRGRQWVPIGGPFHYRDVWLRDGARAVHALAVSGHGPEARALAEGLALLQWPHGPFLSQRGQLDGTGQALWAFEQAALRPAPDTATARFAASAWIAWQWSERQRASGAASGWRFGRMLPFGDPRDAELARAQLVGNDAWMIAGYRATERLLAAAGLAAEADSVRETRERYAADFRAALARTGRRDVPPSWQGVGRDWGNLAVGYPTRALPADDPRLAALARRVWDEAGGPGLGYYGSRDSLHTYNFADLGTWALLAGDRASADRTLDAMLLWRSASGGAAEMFRGPTRDWGVNPPPHATSAAVLLDLIRNSLVYDEDDTLRLTLGARARWWQGAEVRRSPTFWGLVDLAFRREGDVARWRWTAVPVWTALTPPPGTEPAAELRPGLVRGAGATILAPPGTREARVAIRDVAP